MLEPTDKSYKVRYSGKGEGVIQVDTTIAPVGSRWKRSVENEGRKIIFERV